MPAKLEHVEAISLNKERMPAKSTYFYPKLLSGSDVQSPGQSRELESRSRVVQSAVAGSLACHFT